MSALGGLLATAAALLVGGGAVKLARPQTTAKALGLPALVVRAGAAAELAVGVGALARGGVLAATLVALSYVAFATFVAWALWRRLPLATCACFGEPDSPPTVLHLVIDLGLAAAAAAAAIAGGVPSLFDIGPAGAVGVTVAAYVTFLSLTALPRLAAMTS